MVGLVRGSTPSATMAPHLEDLAAPGKLLADGSILRKGDEVKVQGVRQLALPNLPGHKHTIENGYGLTDEATVADSSQPGKGMHPTFQGPDPDA